jgi:sterol desaturase/sphingolipid hydroxylase (fatty acid hydroxylase superfamily)
MVDNLKMYFSTFYEHFFGFELRISPVYLIAFALIGYLIYRLRKIKTPFLQWLLPSKMLFSDSSKTDMKLFIIGRLLSISGFLGAISIRVIIAGAIFVALGGEIAKGNTSPLLVAFLLLLISDFAVYWVHRLHHVHSVLWPFHSVHHSAEVLTPITVYRKHPLYDVLSQLVHSALIGGLQGFLLALVTSKIGFTLIASVNVFYFLFNILGSNFRHSHIWLSYGRMLEHILISPAQHQIHHSLAVKHHNKNYGEVLAIWDWMFGTLYVPKNYEDLRFGLADRNGVLIPQPHQGLWQSLIVPFQDSLRAIKISTGSAKPKANSPPKDE